MFDLQVSWQLIRWEMQFKICDDHNTNLPTTPPAQGGLWWSPPNEINIEKRTNFDVYAKIKFSFEWTNLHYNIILLSKVRDILRYHVDICNVECKKLQDVVITLLDFHSPPNWKVRADWCYEVDLNVVTFDWNWRPHI